MRLFYLFILLCFSCAKPIVRNDLSKAGLRHHVKSVRTLTTTYEGDRVERNEGDWDTYVLYNGAGNEIERKGWRMNGRLSFKQLVEYDASGREVARMVFQANGKLREKTSYRFNELGQHIETQIHNSNGKVVQRYVLLYDEMGNQIERQYHRMGRIANRQVSEFTPDNKIERFTIYKGDGSVDKQSIYKYDEREMEVRVVNGKGEELSRMVSKLDGDGNVVGTFNYHAGDSLAYKSKKYELDKKGNEIAYYSYVLGKVVSQKASQYDKKGRLIERVKYSSKHRFISKQSFKFDAKDNLIEQVDYAEDDTVINKINWTYKYDRYKNWVRKSEYQGAQLKVLIVREITYYNSY